MAIWIYLIIALLTFLMSPRDTKAQQRRALLNGVLAGAGAYYVGTQTDWGRDIVAQIDGPPNGVPPGSTVNPDGTITGPDGRVINVPGAGNSTNGWDVLAGWGATGTATVIGTTAVASNLKKYLPWLIIGLVGWKLLSN